MNFEVGEKQAKVAARARVHESARGCGRECAPSQLETPGRPGRWSGSEGRGTRRGWRGQRRLGLARRVPATQLRRGFSPLLLLNLLAQSFLRCSPAPLPANFPGQSDKPGGVEGSGEVKEA